jgi:hypothetical protein
MVSLWTDSWRFLLWSVPLMTICRFSWANGLFGQMIIDLSVRKPQILQLSFQ